MNPSASSSSSAASQLLQRLMPPAQRQNVDDGIRLIRNKLRKYSARSVVEIALNELWSNRGSKVENLRAAPWISMLLAKWSLADRMVHIDSGARIPQGVFDLLRQAVWDLPHRVEEEVKPTSLLALMRPTLQQQMEFQRSYGWGFVRWPALIARRSAGDAISKRFREAMRMDPETYIDLAWAVHASTMSGKPRIPETFFAPLRPRYGVSIDEMLSLFTRDLPALRAELNKPDAQKVRGRGELHEFAYLRRFPFVRLDAASIVCWHSAVLARGLEDAVHLRLSDYGEQYTKPFSRIFENYVIELTLEASPAAVTEQAYEDALGPQASRVEALLLQPGCNVLVEAKMALFADSVLVTDNADSIYHKTVRVFDAVEKGWKVSSSLASASNPFYRSGVEESYLLVVTSRQLHLGPGHMLAALYPAGKLVCPDSEAGRLLPLEHIFILSIEEFERACAIVKAGTVTFEEMLRKAVQDNTEPANSKLYFDQHLDQYRGGRPKPELIRLALQASRDRLKLELPED